MSLMLSDFQEEVLLFRGQIITNAKECVSGCLLQVTIETQSNLRPLWQTAMCLNMNI